VHLQRRGGGSVGTGRRRDGPSKGVEDQRELLPSRFSDKARAAGGDPRLRTRKKIAGEGSNKKTKSERISKGYGRDLEGDEKGGQIAPVFSSGDYYLEEKSSG